MGSVRLLSPLYASVGRGCDGRKEGREHICCIFTVAAYFICTAFHIWPDEM